MTQTSIERAIRDTVRQLKALRQEQGLSHDGLARKAGITRAAISHIEGGKRKPSLMIALKLAHALGVQLSDILKKSEKEI